MDLKNLIADKKSITVDFPGMEGFKVEIAYASKETVRKLGEKSKTIGFDPKTRQPTEVVDDKLFSKLLIEETLQGWTGLKYEYLKDLILLENAPEEGELPYSQDNAVTLVESSKMFDAWLTEVMSDISLFNKGS